jgi:membrane-associated phospholipid phosphatase
MPLMQRYELDWIAVLQSDGGLAQVMIWISYLGSEALSIALPFTYFVLSRAVGMKLYLLVSVSNSLIGPLKVAFHLPRPYWVDPRIRQLSGSYNYGMPSGHVLNAAVTWPLVGRAIGRPWVWPIALLLVVMVSLSRVYLGVHFISDVMGAWLVAAALIRGFGWMERSSSRCLGSMSTAWRLTVAGWTALAVLALGMGVQEMAATLASPLPWPEQAGNPADLNRLFHTSSEFLGAACGVIMAERWARFGLSCAWWRRGAALGYALAGLWLLRDLDDLVPDARHEGVRLGQEFLRGAIPNWWALFLAPWVLLKVGLLPGTTSEPPPCGGATNT